MSVVLIVAGILVSLGVFGGVFAWFKGKTAGATAQNDWWISTLSKLGLPLATGGASGFLSLLSQYWWIVAIVAVAAILVFRRFRR